MPHICVTELGHHWFRYWLVSCSAPSHYLNQCWLIVNWTPGSIIEWNLNRNSIIFIQENAIWKCRLPKWQGWVGWVWVWVWVCGCGCGWGGVGGCRGWGAEWSVKCLLDTWLGIGANWHHKSVWYTLMSNTYMDVILWSVCYFLVYCTMCYIALFICPALSLGSKCT